jgi:hypothetical protein
VAAVVSAAADSEASVVAAAVVSAVGGRLEDGSLCPFINGLFAQSLRYAQKIILGILYICLWLFFSHALILNKNSHLWMDTI